MPRIAQEISSFSTREVSGLFATARRFYKDAGVTILGAPARGDFGRVLIVVSRKVGDAPTRNKLKRRIRAIFYQNQLYAYILDCIIITRKPILSLRFSKLQDLLITIVQKMSDSIKV